VQLSKSTTVPGPVGGGVLPGTYNAPGSSGRAGIAIPAGTQPDSLKTGSRTIYYGVRFTAEAFLTPRFPGPAALLAQVIQAAKPQVKLPGHPFQDQWRLIGRAAVHQHHLHFRFPLYRRRYPAAHYPLGPVPLVPQQHRQTFRIPYVPGVSAAHTPYPVQHHKQPAQEKRTQQVRQNQDHHPAPFYPTICSGGRLRLPEHMVD